MLIRKFKKMIFFPSKFFSDSKWFSKPNYFNKCKESDIVFLTTLGQLNQIQVLFKLKGIKDATLVILYTQKNVVMPRLVYENVNNTIFRSVYHFELPEPRYLENITSKYFSYLSRGYQSILKEVKPRNIYVMSFSGHYSILLATAVKLKIKVNLVEEGTGTYAPIANYYNIKLTKIEKVKLKNFLSEKGYFNKYDAVYLSFPELGREIFLSDNFNFFFPHIAGISVNNYTVRLCNKYNIKDKDSIYVSQQFAGVDPDIYYTEVLNILDNRLKEIEGKIFIKLHPREMKNSKILNLIKSKISNKRLVIFEEPAFLIDPVIYITEPRSVIGITSTALVYVPLVSPVTQSISIAKLLIQKLDELSQDTEIIKNHLDILKQYHSVDVLGSEDKVKITIYSDDIDVLTNKAEEEYKNKNYYHAIFYWRLAFKSNISILRKKSLWYYNALNKVGQRYKMKAHEIDYINTIQNFNQKDLEIWGNIKNDFIEYGEIING